MSRMSLNWPRIASRKVVGDVGYFNTLARTDCNKDSEELGAGLPDSTCSMSTSPAFESRVLLISGIRIRTRSDSGMSLIVLRARSMDSYLAVRCASCSLVTPTQSSRFTSEFVRPPNTIFWDTRRLSNKYPSIF